MVNAKERVDSIWNLVQQSYNNMPLDTIARAYVHHTQMVNAIYSCKGGDEYARTRGGLHCGVRKPLMPVCDDNNRRIGVEAVETLQDEVDLDRKYATPTYQMNHGANICHLTN